MRGKAPLLRADRTLSGLIVACLMLSAFAGLFAFVNSAPTRAQAEGDLIVTGGTYTIEGIVQPIDGDVVVQSTGHLVVRDATLSVISNYGARHTITVDGGTLTLDHGTITSYLDQIDPWAELTLIVTNGGVLEASGNSLLRFPGSIQLSAGATVTLYDTVIDALPVDQVNQYVVGSSGLITTDSADDGPAISVVDSTMNLFDSEILALPEYPLDMMLAGNITLSGSSMLLAVNSYIGVDFGPAITPAHWYTHNMLAIGGLSNAYLYGCSFEPYTGANADRAPAVTAGGFIYKWLNVTVGDEYGVPVKNATIVAHITGITDYEGVEAFYYSPSGSSTVPPVEVLDYLGENATSFRMTKSNGIAVIPYLTDMIEVGGSHFVGSYALTGSASFGGPIYSSTSNFSFEAYPAMSLADRSYDFTVRIEGVSAETPDPARWLVVNQLKPELTIEDMSYYHAGDVIVAAGGTLTISDAVLQLVQSSAYQRTVYVDGTQAMPARLIIDNSYVTSSLPINIVVQGYGELQVTNSDLTGVNIQALEQATVTFNNVDLSGAITTEYDSAATINIYDSNLSVAPVLAGQTRGGFTDTFLPSITVLDDAEATIYRWIHATVSDGAGYPLPGAVVATKYFYNGTPAGSAVTDASGVALVNSKGTVITAVGSTFVGNYRVSASFTHGAAVYPSEDPAEISIGVAPYTEPLQSNTTYVSLQIPGALPDLVLTADPISSNPASPKFDQLTTLSIRVDNIGAVAAHDVSADFYDNGDAIGSSTVSAIPADGFGYITLLWYADLPLGSDSPHLILVEVDPDNTVPELVEPAPGSVLNATKSVTVQSLPDVHVQTGASELWTEPSAVVINVPAVIKVKVHNEGTSPTGDVLVEFYDEPVSGGSSLIGTTTVTGVQPNNYLVAQVTWTPASNGSHNIRVKANGGWLGTHTFDELTFTNNEVVGAFNVYDPPDLRVYNLVFSPTERVPGGDILVITATVQNVQAAPFVNPNIALYKDSSTGLPLMTGTIYQTLASGGTAVARFEFQTPEVTASEDWIFVLVVNPSQSPAEQTYLNNEVTGTMTILDVRPDLHLTAASMEVMYGQSPVQSSYFGRTVYVYTTVDNLGGRNTSFSFRLNVTDLAVGGYNATLHTGTFNVSSEALNHTTTIVSKWDIKLPTPGLYHLVAMVDREFAINEPNEADNIAMIDFTISQLAVTVTAFTDEVEYRAGDDVIVSLTIKDAETTLVVPSVPQISVWLAEKSNPGVPVEGSVVVVNGNENGMAIATVPVPEDIDTGTYIIRAEILGVEYTPTAADLSISAAVKGGWLPLWLLVLIVVVIGASIAGFTVYLYKWGLGKYVECGECGAFISASEKRCPKCGVEFEVGTMKCSECGAWIPAESTECPNCGVKFVGEIEEGDYLEQMKKQYEENIVSKYRELAKIELGRKLKDDQFEAWFKRQPGYISFDDWLAKEEEKKKEGPIPCPVCGTLNPKEATVCHKCGTVFAVAGAPPGKGPPPGAPPMGPSARPMERRVEAAAPPAEEGPPEAQAPQAAPRMVIRRPIDRKVVPKKIVKTPVGEETQEIQDDEGREGQ